MTDVRERAAAALDGWPLWAVIVLAGALIPILGTVDLLTGYELSFSLFYLLPVTIAAWFGSRFWGHVTAGMAAASWLTATVASGHVYSAEWVPYWNASLRLSVFLVVAHSISGLGAALRREAESARTDYLTGVANSRAFAEMAAAEIERSRRFSNPFSIAYIDVDRFKQVNDLLGHDAGDRLLRDISRSLTTTVRAPDAVGRVGGDEFALLLVETDYQEAEATVSRVRHALSAMTRAQGWDVTFSIGVATFLEAPASVESALQRADQAMYVVKRHGRDDVQHAVWEA